MCRRSMFVAAASLSFVYKACASYSLSAQLQADRAHAKALGLQKSAAARMACPDRSNIETCLGSLFTHNNECAWCGEKCIASPMDKLKGCHSYEGEKHDLCLTCIFRYTCSQWAQAQEDGGCAEDEEVVVWEDGDPTSYSSYRQVSGYNCRGYTCDSKDQCCYKKKPKKADLPTCKDFPEEYCVKYNRLPKASKADIVCSGRCSQSDCCDDTCAKPDWGYCRTGTLYPKDVAKTIRCMTPSKYRGRKPDCSDEQCCDFGDQEQKFSIVPELTTVGTHMNLALAVAMISGLALAGSVVVAMRRRIVLRGSRPTLLPQEDE